MQIRQHVWFIGVTTGQSAIHRIFPAWAAVLGIDVDLEGRDLPLDATAGQYHALIDRMAATPGLVGAVVTSHKVRLLDAARDRFTTLDSAAAALGEASSIAVRADGLHAAATDPMAIRRALDEMLGPPAPGAPGMEGLVFGVGGSARALALATLVDLPRAEPAAAGPAPRVRRLHAVARRPASAAEFATVLDRASIARDRFVIHVQATQAENEGLLAQMPGGSLVVNATGLGKDAPGSPIGDRALFPRGGIAWDFNYRGTLEFERIAAAQRDRRGLQVHDGWRYFLHGWVAALAPFLPIPGDEATFARLAQVAEAVRPPAAI